MDFDFSDLADSFGCATGMRALAQSGQAPACSCSCCAAHDAPARSSLVEADPHELFESDEFTAPPVIGE